MKSFFALGILLQIFCGTAFGQRPVQCSSNGDPTTINILRSRAEVFDIRGCNFSLNSFSCDHSNKCNILSSYSSLSCVAYEFGSSNIARFSNLVINQNIGLVTGSCYDNLRTRKRICEMFVRNNQGQFLSKQGCQNILDQLNNSTAGTNPGTIPGTPGNNPGNIPQTYPPVAGPQEFNCISYGDQKNIQRFMNVVNRLNSTIERTTVSPEERTAKKITATIRPSTRPGISQVIIKSNTPQLDCERIKSIIPTLRSQTTLPQDCGGCFDEQNSYCASNCEQYWINGQINGQNNGQNFRCYDGRFILSDYLRKDIGAVNTCADSHYTVINQ